MAKVTFYEGKSKEYPRAGIINFPTRSEAGKKIIRPRKKVITVSAFKGLDWKRDGAQVKFSAKDKKILKEKGYRR